MKIVSKSRELTAKELYFLTMAPTVQRMKDAIDQRIEVVASATYTDTNSDGEEQTILSILTPEDEVFATNSKTFQRDFEKMNELFASADESVKAIRVITGTSKAGREFITCVFED